MAGRRPAAARRALPQVPLARLAAAAGLVAVSATLYWVTSDEPFAVDPGGVPVSGAVLTDEAAVRDSLGLPDDRLVNVFRLSTTDMERRVEELPAVRSADVVATLPNRLEVVVRERVPLLVWLVGADAWLVDAEGMLFAPASALGPGEVGTGATGTSLPAVDDRRSGTPLAIRSRIPGLDLEVVRLLLTVTPDLVGSDAPELHVWVDDLDGYVLEAPERWRAVFGPYTPVLRPPSLIPRQVQCLDALLRDRERSVAVVTLALTDDACGTFLERPRPRETEKAERGRP